LAQAQLRLEGLGSADRRCASIESWIGVECFSKLKKVMLMAACAIIGTVLALFLREIAPIRLSPKSQ
jgi:hypothetical protein